MTKYIVTDEQDKAFHKRLWELENRWRKNILPPEQTLLGLQWLIEQRVVKLDYSEWLSAWERFYEFTFGRSYDFSNIRIPAGDDDFSWPICMPGEISVRLWLEGGKNPIPFTGGYGLKEGMFEICDLDFSYGREAWNHPYIVMAQPSEDVPMKLKNVPEAEIRKMKIQFMTLRERLAIGRFLLWHKVMKLDMLTVTLCMGSRLSNGLIPHVFWQNDMIHVGYALDEDFKRAISGPRQVLV